MVNAQEWLDQNYPQEKRAETERLFITKQLEGILDLVDFIKLWKLYLYPNIDESKFTIITEEWGMKINKLVWAQEWLDNNYPLTERNEIDGLDISSKNLTGELKLIGFSNLIWFNCFYNQLTKLDLSNCSTLTELECDNNQITNLNLNNCSTLTELSCWGNQLVDLTIFSRLVNLVELDFAGNSFTGTLEPLRKLTKLKKLSIEYNKFTDGLEYLPEDLQVLIGRDKVFSNEGVSREITKSSSWEKYEANDYEAINANYSSSLYVIPQINQWKQNQPLWKWLVEQLTQINPYLNVRQFLTEQDIFFNVVNGNFEIGLSFVTSSIKKDLEIINLRTIITQISSLQSVISEQQELINHKIQSYLEQKEHLEEFVKIYVEFKKLESKKFTDEDELDELCEKWGDISDKLIKSKVKGIRRFVDEIKRDCDKLVELETSISEFREKTKGMINVTISNSSISVEQGNLLIGNQIRDNVSIGGNQFNNSTLTAMEMDFSHQKTITAYQEVPPKS